MQPTKWLTLQSKTHFANNALLCSIVCLREPGKIAAVIWLWQTRTLAHDCNIIAELCVFIVFSYGCHICGSPMGNNMSFDICTCFPDFI
jgi:hypothetical protein